MTEPAIRLLDISRRFGSTRALDSATLTAHAGTVHALLGENGAGKTTLMRVAFGVTQPDNGSVILRGRTVRLRTPADAIAAGIGMVHQHPAHVGTMSVSENIELGGKGLLYGSAATERIRSLIASTRIDINPAARVADLSVAAQQRVEILKAVNRDATLLIFDEPTAVLAPEESAELYAWMREFARGGGTAIVITHKLEEARKHADEITVLRSGRTVWSGPAQSVTTALLAEAMVGVGHAEQVATPRAAETPGARVVVSAAGISLARRRGTRAIDNASFELRAGEITGVAGVEGSGHHELLLAVAGRVTPVAGTLDLPMSIGLVPEDRHRDAVALEFSLEENVAIHGAGARKGLMRWSRVRGQVSALLTAYDVRSQGPTQAMAALSGGNQQKVVLARELESDPQLLVVENPTRGLDIRASAFVRSRLEAARNAGCAVVMYSSDLDELVEVCDRILVVFSGTVREVARNRQQIGSAMLGAQ